jgi:hypothetical protein
VLPPWPWRALVVPALVTTLLFGFALVCSTWMHALVVLLPGLGVWSWWVWRRMLRPHEKTRLRHLSGRLSRRQ